MRVFGLVLLLLVSTGRGHAAELVDQLVTLTKKNPKIQTLAIIYNPHTSSQSDIPARLGDVSIVPVPVKQIRQVPMVLNRKQIEKYSVDGLYVMDDHGKVVTSGIALKLIRKLKEKHHLAVFADRSETLARLR